MIIPAIPIFSGIGPKECTHNIIQIATQTLIRSKTRFQTPTTWVACDSGMPYALLLEENEFHLLDKGIS